MITGIASAALWIAVCTFAVGEVVVLYQIFREARQGHCRTADWLTQTAWALVPLLMLGTLLLAATSGAAPRSTRRSVHAAAETGR